MQDIIKGLNEVKGLKVLISLNKEHKELIKRMEERNNIGVFESINRDFTLLLSHNSTFRKPLDETVIIKDSNITFPPVSFPEINAKNVVSSSPSKKVHDILKNKLKLNLKDDDATLLVGFDI